MMFPCVSGNFIDLLTHRTYDCPHRDENEQYMVLIQLLIINVRIRSKFVTNSKLPPIIVFPRQPIGTKGTDRLPRSLFCMYHCNIASGNSIYTY